jgi:putative transposase
MSRFKKLTHTIYECKYHIVFCPKYRHRILREDLSEYCRQQMYQLARGKELVEILELNIQPDHVHMVISIAPKYSVSSMMRYLKGKLALRCLKDTRVYRSDTGDGTSGREVTV